MGLYPMHLKKVGGLNTETQTQKGEHVRRGTCQGAVSPSTSHSPALVTLSHSTGAHNTQHLTY